MLAAPSLSLHGRLSLLLLVVASLLVGVTVGRATDHRPGARSPATAQGKLRPRVWTERPVYVPLPPR